MIPPRVRIKGPKASVFSRESERSTWSPPALRSEQPGREGGGGVVTPGSRAWSFAELPLGPAPALRVGGEQDPLEREADSMADRALGQLETPASFAAARGERSLRLTALPIVQRQCAECSSESKEEPEYPLVRRKAAAGQAPAAVSSIVHSVLKSPGSPLEAGVRATFEPRFGHDFANVRVHTGPVADASARALSARAYTFESHVVFADREYQPASYAGQRLLAHELAHVVQQAHGARPVIRRSTGSASTPRGLAVDVLSAQDPEDFLVRGAAEALGIDIRVRSMDDLATQVAALGSGSRCIERLRIFNHANPSHQAVVGGSKLKTAEGQRTQAPTSGFSLDWLFAAGNQTALNRLRGSLCCGSAMDWFGCSTAGVWAEGGRRTEAASQSNHERYTGTLGDFYHSTADALAHGATRFRYVGSANVQSWANALCTSISAATDFTSWRTVDGRSSHTVIHGGQQVVYRPQSDMHCDCDAATGRTVGSAPSAEELRQRGTTLREHYLQQLYQAQAALGTAVSARVETPEQRAAREQVEQRDAARLQALGDGIRADVSRTAGLAVAPTTADEALRVTRLWGLDLPAITRALSTLSTSLATRTVGQTSSGDMATRQEQLIAALTPRGRETFMSALATVRQEHFWDRHLATHTIYMLPDLSGSNRYRGFTERGTRAAPGGATINVYAIHLSKDLLESGATELATASMVHELSHTLGGNDTGRAMNEFTRSLSVLLVDHPQIVALRSGTADPAAARGAQVTLLNQMLFDATGYAEGEIFVHLLQLTHQPNMTVNGGAVRGSDFILSEVTDWIHRLRRIGMSGPQFNGLLRDVIRRALATYDERIAAAPANSPERRMLETNKRLAQALVAVAVNEAARSP